MEEGILNGEPDVVQQGKDIRNVAIEIELHVMNVDRYISDMTLHPEISCITIKVAENPQLGQIQCLTCHTEYYSYNHYAAPDP